MSKTDKVARIWREDQLKNHPEQTNVFRPDLMHLPRGEKGDKGEEGEADPNIHSEEYWSGTIKYWEHIEEMRELRKRIYDRFRKNIEYWMDEVRKLKKENQRLTEGNDYEELKMENEILKTKLFLQEEENLSTMDTIKENNLDKEQDD